MKYEKTGKKAVNVDLAAIRGLDRVDTWKIVKYLMGRHKLTLLAVWAVLMTVLALYPLLSGL